MPLQVQEGPKLNKNEISGFVKDMVTEYQINKNKTNPDKLTPKMENKIVNLIAKTGLTHADAALACGVTERTFQNWLSWGKKEAERVQIAIQTALKELIEQDKINPNDSEQLELFISEFTTKLKPNKFFKFFMKLEQAKAKVLAEQLENIKRAGKGGKYLTEQIIHKDKDGNIKKTETKSRYSVPQWGASAWILERLRPDIYSETKKVQSTMDIQGEVNHNVKIDLESSKAAQMLEILLNSDYLALSDNTAIDAEIVD